MMDFDAYQIPEHMHDGVRLYVENGVEPGGFLYAVLTNDFKEACGRADSTNRECLFEWAGFIYNELPSQCQGSPEKVQAWIECGGGARG